MVVGWSSILGRRSLGRLERRNRKADFYLGNSRQKFVSLRQRWPASKLKGFLYLHFGSGPTSPSQASAFALIVVRPPLLGAKRSLPNGCRRLALRACEENCYRTASRYRCAGKAAAYLPASSCSCLAAHDRDWTLPRFAVTFGPYEDFFGCVRSCAGEERPAGAVTWLRIGRQMQSGGEPWPLLRQGLSDRPADDPP